MISHNLESYSDTVELVDQVRDFFLHSYDLLESTEMSLWKLHVCI